MGNRPRVLRSRRGRALRRLAAAVVVLLAATPMEAADRPVALARPDGGVALTLPVDLLSRRDIAQQLNSGLTTTFAISAQAGSRRGGARIEIRYEPWDEVYFVTARGIDLKVHSVKVRSLDRLKAWWREAALLAISNGTGVTKVDVSVEVLPFSIEEQEETQQWLTRSLGEAHRQESLDPGEVVGSPGAASVLDVLIGTSIQRRPILRYRWSVPITR